jgi:hypothetical protein
MFAGPAPRPAHANRRALPTPRPARAAPRPRRAPARAPLGLGAARRLG